MKEIIMCLVVAMCSFTVFSQDASVRKKHFNLDDGIALDGYDAVAYITQLKAVRGSRNFAVAHEGVNYYFSSAANKEEFRRNPSKYEPAYGGWCAYAMGAKGEKVTIDPETFKVLDGKLYLFYNRFFNNTKTSWDKDEVNLKRKADVNWQKITH